jgi:hypothetical protein
MPNDEERMPSDGKYVVTHCDFRIADVKTTVSEILPGYSIVDSAQMAYRVLSVDPPSTYLGVFNCYSVELRVFRDTITIKLPSDSIDFDSSPLTAHNSTITAQPAAIQEISAEFVEFQHKKGFRKRFSIWLLTDPVLPLGSLLVDQSGVTYVVEAVQNRNRIDELTLITAVVNP